LDPLADDDAGALLLFYGPMFVIWGLAGFVAARRTGRIVGAVKVAAIVAFVTFIVFDARKEEGKARHVTKHDGLFLPIPPIT